MTCKTGSSFPCGQLPKFFILTYFVYVYTNCLWSKFRLVFSYCVLLFLRGHCDLKSENFAHIHQLYRGTLYVNMKRIEDGHHYTFPKIWSVGMERPLGATRQQ